MTEDYKRYWLKEAIIYSLDTRSYKDGNNDGLGDLKGLLSKLDYLVDLGINCLWLVPFYRSSNHDGGYDVIDYYQVDPQLGDLEEFKLLVQKAKSHNIRIIIDLVVNHTSKEHPWFLEAKNRQSSLRNYYIWMEEKPENDRDDVVFKTVEDSNWEYCEETKSYYYHTFYKYQPDLNVANPAVQEEILNIINFWMKTGIAGFRIDAVPHILKNKGEERFQGDPYDVIDIWKGAILAHDKEAILIGEADVEPEDYPKFFNKGKKINGLFNFFLNNYLFLAMAEHCAKPLKKAFERLPSPGYHGQYLNFIRNHDELDLERLTNEERSRVFEIFAPCPFMRIYDRGIRRRFPPMVNNNLDRVKLAMSFLLTLPGSPVIRYGEEIGMGDDLRLPERESVRTTMQWDTSLNGGFSGVNPNDLRWDVIKDEVYGYQTINVANQQENTISVLQQVKKMISIRKEQLALNYGIFKILETNHPQVMVYLYSLANENVLLVHNLSYGKEHVQVSESFSTNQFHVLLGNGNFDLTASQQLILRMPAYSYSWLSFKT